MKDGSRAADALSAAIEALGAAGVESPRLDAEVMLSSIAGLDRARLISDPTVEIPSVAARGFAAAVRRRLSREPVAYILGSKGFRHLDLNVDSRVLIPRPETELLVELALEIEPQTVLEIGTGSGAIALAVADELPSVTVLATDVSADSLDVARANAARTGLAERVEFLEGSLPASGEFDLILANLPYVAESEPVAPEIARFEPHGAVFGGPDGLAAFEAVLSELGRSGVAAPVIGLEIGRDQGEAVSRLVQAAGFPCTRVRPDLAGLDRVVVGRRA